MNSGKTIFYAVIAALIGILAITGLLLFDAPAPSGAASTGAVLSTGTETLSTDSETLSTGTETLSTDATGSAIGRKSPDDLPEPGWPRTVTDGRGITTAIERRPRRIISLAPNVTQILRAIGADEALVAIPREGSDPAESADLVRLQVYPAPSPEAIFALRPDLLVGADITSPAVAARLRSLGLPLVILSGNDYQGIMEDIARAGEATGHEATAAILGQALLARLEAVRAEVAAATRSEIVPTAENPPPQAKTTHVVTTTDNASQPPTAQPDAPAATDDAPQPPTAQPDAPAATDTRLQTAGPNRPRALLFVGETPDYAAGPGSYAADLLHLVGADNMALRLKQPWPQLSREFILEANPQVLIFTVRAAALTSTPEQPGRSEHLSADLRGDPLWRQLEAVRNNRVYAIDQNLLSIPGPQVGEALAQLRAIIRDAAQPPAAQPSSAPATTATPEPPFTAQPSAPPTATDTPESAPTPESSATPAAADVTEPTPTPQPPATPTATGTPESSAPPQPSATPAAAGTD